MLGLACPILAQMTFTGTPDEHGDMGVSESVKGHFLVQCLRLPGDWVQRSWRPVRFRRPSCTRHHDDLPRAPRPQLPLRLVRPVLPQGSAKDSPDLYGSLPCSSLGFLEYGVAVLIHETVRWANLERVLRQAHILP